MGFFDNFSETVSNAISSDTVQVAAADWFKNQISPKPPVKVEPQPIATMSVAQMQMSSPLAGGFSTSMILTIAAAAIGAYFVFKKGKK